MTVSSQSRAPVVYRFRTDDFDEAREFMNPRFGSHWRVPLARGPLGMELSVCVGRGCVSGSQRTVTPYTVRAVSQSVLVHLPTRVGATYRVGRRTLHSSPEVAVLLAPGHDYTATAAPASAAAALMIDAGLMASAMDSCEAAGGGPSSLRSVEVPLTPVERAELGDLARRHAAAVTVATSSLDAAPLVLVERDIAGWLAARVARSGAIRPLSVSSRRAAELVETWVRQHAAQPVTLEQLASVAGVSARTLQKACLARWGQTPLELVAARRLDVVRAGLSSQPGSLSVTEAAVRAGFTHLGRFAALYRRSYGESPSDTLARARDASRGVARAAAD